MKKSKVRFLAVCTVVAIIGINMIFPINAFAQEQEQETVVIEAFGFFNHMPMRNTLNAIQSTCEKFGDQVELTLYDEDKAEGQAFMESKGLSGHIPMRLYINGSNTFDIDGKTVSFSDFVGREWTADDLEKAITLTLGGSDVAVAGADAPAGGLNYALLIGITASIAVIAVIGFFLLNRREKAKGKSAGKARRKA